MLFVLHLPKHDGWSDTNSIPIPIPGYEQQDVVEGIFCLPNLSRLIQGF